MINRMLSLAVGCVVASSTASAAFVGVDLRTNPAWNAAATTAINDGSSYIVVRLFASFTSNTMSDTIISVGHTGPGSSTAGFGLFETGAVFFQDTFGGNTSPNSGLFGSGGFAPSAEWDTFVSIGRTSSSGLNPDTTNTDPSFAFLNQPAGTGLGDQRFVQGGWFNSNPANLQGAPAMNPTSGMYESFLAQFTVRGHAGGLTSGAPSSTLANNILAGDLDIFTQIPGGGVNTQVVSFTAVPAPSSFALLGVASLAAVRRRRR